MKKNFNFKALLENKRFVTILVIAFVCTSAVFAQDSGSNDTFNNKCNTGNTFYPWT